MTAKKADSSAATEFCSCLFVRCGFDFGCEGCAVLCCVCLCDARRSPIGGDGYAAVLGRGATGPRQVLCAGTAGYFLAVGLH